MTTHYNGSKGPVAIAAMPYPHLKAARDKLVRDGLSMKRGPEVNAMSAELARREAERAAKGR